MFNESRFSSASGDDLTKELVVFIHTSGVSNTKSSFAISKGPVMANAIKDFVRNIFPSSLSEKRDAARHGSKEYLHVENREDSDEENIVYPSEEMTRNSQEAEKSQNTSALQAAWNVLNLIQGKVYK